MLPNHTILIIEFNSNKKIMKEEDCFIYSIFNFISSLITSILNNSWWIHVSSRIAKLTELSNTIWRSTLRSNSRTSTAVNKWYAVEKEMQTYKGIQKHHRKEENLRERSWMILVFCISFGANYNTSYCLRSCLYTTTIL